MTKVEALKQLAVALGCATKVADVTGETSAEVLLFIAAEYNGEGNIPTAPTEAGVYQLTVDAESAATWTAVTTE